MVRIARNNRKCNTLLIICSGRETEKNYFLAMRRHLRISNLKIIPIFTSSSDPVNIVKYAKSSDVLNKYDIDFSSGDKIFCVFDLDDSSSEQLDKAKALAGNKIGLILSNPSFEVWFLLHFIYFTNGISNEELIDKLNELINGGYRKNDKEIYYKLLEKHKDARENLKKLIGFHKRNETNIYSINSNPSSMILDLLKEIDEFES